MKRIILFVKDDTEYSMWTNNAVAYNESVLDGQLIFCKNWHVNYTLFDMVIKNLVPKLKLVKDDEFYLFFHYGGKDEDDCEFKRLRNAATECLSGAINQSQISLRHDLYSIGSNKIGNSQLQLLRDIIESQQTCEEKDYKKLLQIFLPSIEETRQQLSDITIFLLASRHLLEVYQACTKKMIDILTPVAQVADLTDFREECFRALSELKSSDTQACDIKEATENLIELINQIDKGINTKESAK